MAMLDLATIDEIAEKAAKRHLTPENVEGVDVVGTVDSEGNDAIKIIITLKKNVASRLDGDKVLDTLIAIQNLLAKAGEDRLSIVEYAETGELTEQDETSRVGNAKP